MASEDERLRLIAEWQHKALALEAEVARRTQLQEAAAKLAAIVESSEDGIASKDLNGIIQSWNASAERIFGYKADEIVGKSVLTIIPPELHQDEDMILSRIRRGERIEHFETVRVTKNGKRIDVSLTVSPVKDDGGRIIGAAKIVRDISERKRAEEALRTAEKMAATGRLAATIAHEINNPMQALTNLLALVADRKSVDDDTRRLVSLAEAELSRIAHITRQMLSFYRESATPVAVNVAEVVDEILQLFLMKTRSNQIKVERRYEFDGQVQGFPGELGQLFANLISNAIEAVGRKGRVCVHVAPAREFAPPYRQGVRIIVADDGPGIKPEVRDRIFQPFFTTKANKGTGLGLWVVKGIVAKHNGSVRLRSSVRERRSGTVFSVFLPASSGWSVITSKQDNDTDSAVV